MDEIVEPSPTYDFTTLTCISPSSITGGNYFIRILKNPGQKPFYIKPPKCATKQGVVKAGKKLVCDLLFRHEDESFTEFLESLETYCRTQLFANKDKWFDSEMTENDIEEYLTPTAKLYKSGKLHSVRVAVPIRLGKCSLKVFNEEQEDVPYETITENTQVMTIIEVQGIRCSARNFQLELEVKQMMVLNPVALFETCLFKTKSALGIKEVLPPPHVEEEIEEEEEEEEEEEKEKEEEEKEVKEEKEKQVARRKPESLADSRFGLDEVNLEIPEEKGEMKLKKRNYVYYNMYKEAKRKARIARDFAIASYLEAKQIRHSFLEESDLSEDDDKLEKEMEGLDLK